MFPLAKKNKRVKRIYVYRWFGEPRSARFDAGLVEPGRLEPSRPQAVPQVHQGPAPLDSSTGVSDPHPGHALACPG